MTAAVEPPQISLTPYLGDTRARIGAACRGLFDLPDDVGLHWQSLRPASGPDDIGEVQLGLRTPEGREIKVVLREASDDTRWQVGGIGVFVRPPGGSGPPKDEDLRDLLTHLVGRFGHGPIEDAQHHVDELREVLALHHEFRNQQDVMWRRVEHCQGGIHGMLRIGFRCNQDCFFCPQDRTWQDPSPELVAEWLDQFGEAGIHVLTITGGEPTTYRSFPEFVDRAVNHYGMITLVQTNAIQFAKDRYVAKMQEVGLHGLFVSFHSHDEETSDRITRSPRTWKRTVKGMENALAAGFAVALNCCVERNNYQTLAEHAQFIVDRFVTPFPDNPLVSVDYSQPGAYWNGELMEGSIIPYDEIEPYLPKALRILTDAGVGVNATGTCGFVPCMFREDPTVVPWQLHDEYDPRDLQNRKFMEPCERCAARPYCVGVRGDIAQRFGGRGLVPYDEVPQDAVDNVDSFDFDLMRFVLEHAERQNARRRKD